jgi:hypothetical protein
VVRVLRQTSTEEASQFRDVLRAFGTASFSSMMLAASVLLVSPLSGVPLFSSLCGLMIFLIAGQGALGRDHLWLPERLLRIDIGSERAHKVFHGLMRVALWLDARTAARLAVMVRPPVSRLLFGLCALCGAVTPVLEFVPFSASIVGAAVSLIGAGLLARDGLLALLGVMVLPLASVLPLVAVAAVIS